MFKEALNSIDPCNCIKKMLNVLSVDQPIMMIHIDEVFIAINWVLGEYLSELSARTH